MDIDPGRFRTDLRDRILRSPMRSLPQLIIDLVIGQFDRRLKILTECGRTLRYRIGFNSREGIRPIRTGSPDWHPPSGRWPARPSTIQLPWFLNNLTNDSVIELGWFGFTIVSRIAGFRPIYFEEPVNLISLRPLEIKEKTLRTVRHLVVRMGYWDPVCLPVKILAPIRDELVPSCECHSDYLAAYIDGAWDWTLRFICKICGRSYYCDCFRPALERRYLEALELKSLHTESGRPHKFVAAYEKSQFRGSICHLCRGMPSELRYCHPMYGSTVKVHYGPYIRKLAVERNIEESEAENAIRDVLGIPHIGEGWVSERELLYMVKGIFPKNDIIHQASPEWLGRQRLDVFVPELRLGIEYHGRQHYDAIPFFGGGEGLQKTRERDELKARLCSENCVTLVIFRYDETLTIEFVKARIERALKSRLV